MVEERSSSFHLFRTLLALHRMETVVFRSVMTVERKTVRFLTFEAAFVQKAKLFKPYLMVLLEGTSAEKIQVRAQFDVSDGRFVTGSRVEDFGGPRLIEYDH